MWQHMKYLGHINVATYEIFRGKKKEQNDKKAYKL